jgi:hypothetical protein
MNLSYRHDTSDGPVLLLGGATPTGAQALKAAFDGLASGQHAFVRLDSLPGVEAQGGCELVATCNASGTPSRPGPGRFVWSLRPLQWETVAGLVEPFAVAAGTEIHQVLGQAGAATVVMSTANHW